MLIKLVAVGKLRDRFIADRCAEYARRLGAYAKFDCIELPDSDPVGEGRAILREIERERDAWPVALSEEGMEFTTSAMAGKLAALDRKALFIIGGPFGLVPEVKNRCRLVWSLSRLTFPHEIARLLFYEQLYRMLNFNHGGSYHHS